MCPAQRVRIVSVQRGEKRPIDGSLRVDRADCARECEVYALKLRANARRLCIIRVVRRDGMFWPIYVYLVSSLVIAGSAAISAGLGPAFYVIATSSLFLAAGGGWKASLLQRDKTQKVGGSVVAALILVLAQWLSSGFSVHLFGHALSGAAWGWIGFAICLVFATQKLTGQSVPIAVSAPSAESLLRALGSVIENYPTALMDASRLPAPKQTMKAVIKEAWQREPRLRPQLMHAYLHLSYFQDGIGDTILDFKLADIRGTADGRTDLEAVRQQASEMTTGPKGENNRKYLEWSKVSLEDMKMLVQEWRAFENQESGLGGA